MMNRAENKQSLSTTRPDNSEKLIALTGGSGFLGSHIADALLAAGYRVRVAVRATSNLQWLTGKDLSTVEVNLNDETDCQKFVGDASAVLHCAGVVAADNEQAYHTGNVSTTETLLKACAKSWQNQSNTFLLISSMAAHGPAGIETPATENSPENPITAYGRSKLAAEKLTADTDWLFRTAILRPPSLYGPRDREFLPLFKAATFGFTARIGKSMTGLSLVDGRDAAAAAVAIVQHPTAAGTFFVDDGMLGYNWQQLADALGQAVGKKVRQLVIPLEMVKTVAFLVGEQRAARSPILSPDRINDLESAGWVCDGSRLCQTTGFKAQWNAARGFTDTIQFCKEQRWL